MTASGPLVSVGIPVYNGARHIRQALDAIVRQTYEHMEIIICDNASNDGTINICREFVLNDDRCKLYQNQQNIGSIDNFNKALLLASGKYFMWAAYDDIFLPDYVKSCVNLLEHDIDLVGCCSGMNLIDEDGNFFSYGDSSILDNVDLDQLNPIDRLRSWFCRDGWFALYSVFRLEFLRSSPRLINVYGTDVVFVAELLMRGRIAKIPRVLFYYRIHTTRTELDRLLEQGVGNVGHEVDAYEYSRFKLFLNLFDSISRWRASPLSKLSAIYHLTRCWEWRPGIRGELVHFVVTSLKARRWGDVSKTILTLGLSMAGTRLLGVVRNICDKAQFLK